MEEEERGLSLADVFKIIFKRIWWVVGVTAAVMLVFVLVVQFWYNKSNRYYSVSYEVVYPGSETGKYPDGTSFRVIDSISQRNLQDIKEGKYSSADEASQFSDVDIDNMLDKDKISLDSKMEQAVDGSINRTYTLNINASCFNSSKQAVAFMRQVAAYPVYTVDSIVETDKYGLYLDIYDGAESYEAKIEALVKQKDYVLKKYTTLATVGGNVVEVNMAKLANLFTENQQKLLKDEIVANNYVLDITKYVSEAKTTVDALVKEINDLDIKIAEQDKQIADNVSGSVVIASEKKSEYLERRGECKIEIQDILNTLKKSCGFDSTMPEDAELKSFSIDIDNLTPTADYTAKNAAFKAKLDGYMEKLGETTDTLKETTIDIYAENAQVVYSSNNVKVNGGLNIILAAVIGAIAGFVLVSIVVYIIDAPKYKRKKFGAAEGAVEEKVPEGEGKTPQPEEADKKE